MGASAKRLRSAKYRDYKTNHHRRVRFRCDLTSHNAGWPASPPPTRRHVSLWTVPLEAGRYWVVSLAVIAYIFLVKGSDLALLGNRSGGSPGGQSNRFPGSLVIDSLTFFAVGVYRLKFER